MRLGHPLPNRQNGRPAYRTLENVIEGAVIRSTEISIMKKAWAALRDSEAQRRLAVVVRDAREAIGCRT